MKLIEHLRKTEFKWIMGFSILVIVVFPLALTRDFHLISFKDTGEIGDTIGGITAPFMSLISFILIYMAYHEQTEANKHLKDANTELMKANDEHKRTEIRRFYMEEYKSLFSRIEKVAEYLDAFENRLQQGEPPYELGQNLKVQVNYVALFDHEFKELFKKTTEGKFPDEDIANRLSKMHFTCFSQNAMSLGAMYKLAAENDPIGNQDLHQLSEDLLETTILVLGRSGRKLEESIKNNLEAIKSMKKK